MDKTREMDLDLMSDARKDARTREEALHIGMIEYVTYKMSQDKGLTGLRDEMLEAMREGSALKYDLTIAKIEKYVEDRLKPILATDIRTKFGEREMNYYLTKMK